MNKLFCIIACVVLLSSCVRPLNKIPKPEQQIQVREEPLQQDISPKEPEAESQQDYFKKLASRLLTESHAERSRATLNLQNRIWIKPEVLDGLNNFMKSTSNEDLRKKVELFLKPYKQWEINTQMLETFPKIIVKLISRDPEIRIDTIQKIASINPDRFVKLLSFILCNDGDNNVRKFVAELLRDNGGNEAIAGLIEAMKCGHIESFKNLRRIGFPAIKPLIEVLRDNNSRFAYFILVSITRKTLRNNYYEWIKWYDENEKKNKNFIQIAESGRPWKAVEKIVKLGNMGTGPLAELLNNKDKDIRIAAIWGLRKIHSDHSRKLLVGILSDKNVNFRFAAVQALTEFGDWETVKFLKKLQVKEEEDSVQLAIAYALFKITNEKEHLDFMLNRLNDGGFTERIIAAMLIGELLPIEFSEALVNSVMESDNFYNPKVLWTFGEIENKNRVIDNVDILINGIKTDNPIIIKSSAIALGLIGSDKAVPHLLKLAINVNEDISTTSFKALEKYGKSLIVEMIELLKDNDIVIKYRVLQSLKKITERDFGLDYAKWKAWYEKNKDK